MGIKKISDDVLFVELPSKSPKIANELKAVNEAASKEGNCDIIIDFSRVEIINSSNISNLLILHNLQVGTGRRLVLCSLATVTKCIFVVAGLNEVFEFAENRSSALDTVGQAG